MNPKKLALALVVPALIIGMVIGYFLGRATLERQWAEPPMTLAPSDVTRSSADGADPTPPAGTHVLQSMPLQRARAAMRDLTAKDPVVVAVGSVGRDDTSADLHLMLENHGDCEVVAYSGVAYGFGPTGLPEPLNAHGEQYVAFSVDTMKPAPKKEVASDDDGAGDDDDADEPIPARGTAKLSRPLKFPHHANIALAQVDHVTCKGGKAWARN